LNYKTKFLLFYKKNKPFNLFSFIPIYFVAITNIIGSAEG